MKLHELLTEEQLNELNWRKAVASGALAASAIAAPGLIDKFTHSKPDAQQVKPVERATDNVRDAVKKAGKRTGVDQLTQIVLAKYKKLDPAIAKQVAELAIKYEKPDFPRAIDILSIVGIESTFRPEAVSALKKDPARGLMQVRPGVWGITPKDLDSAEKQIKFGAKILNDYYQQTGDIDGAVHAYNVGITNYRKQKNLNPGYVAKYKNERQIYDTVAQNDRQ